MAKWFNRAGIMPERSGDGPRATRLGVFGLEVKLADLDSHGTSRNLADGPNAVRRVQINRYEIHGVPIELDDMPVLYRGVGQVRTA